MLLPTISFALMICMNSPKLVKLAEPGDGRQTRLLNGMLIFTCTSTMFLAVQPPPPPRASSRRMAWHAGAPPGPALCPLPSALCPLPSALCPLPSALP